MTSKETPPPPPPPPPTTAGQADPQEIIDEKLMEAMETVVSDEALSKAFGVLCSSMGTSKDHVSADVIRRAMPILGVNVQGIEIDADFLIKAQVENAERIDCQGFIKIMKNIWKGMADSMIDEVEKVIDDFISNKAKLENIRREFSNSLKDTWKRVADSIIPEVEKKIDAFISGNTGQENDGIISGNAGQENDGIIPRKLINSMKDIWKKVTDLKIHEMQKEIDESIPNKLELQNDGTIHRWFIDSLKYLWERVVGSMISQVEKELDAFISNKTELENGGNIRDEFISSLKDIHKKVDDSMIMEEVGSEEVLKLAHAMVLAERVLGSKVSVALLRHLMPYLGGNLEEKIIGDIIDDIKNFKSNVDDGQINREGLIQIIRNIWKNSAEFVSKAMGRDADPKAKEAAFTVLLNPLDDFVSATILKVVMLNLAGNLDFEELHWTIYYVQANFTDKAFVESMENKWKGMADSIINKVEKLIDDFISNDAKLENIRWEFSKSLKDTWKRVADSIIHEVEKEIDAFISGNAGRENDGIILMDSMKDIWKKVADLKFPDMKKEIDESILNKLALQNNGTIHRWFIDGLKYLWERVVDSMISQVEKELDEFISNKTELENGGNIRDEFIINLKDIHKKVDDSNIMEEVGSEEVLKLAYAMVLAETLGSNVSVALLRRLIPYLGGNVNEAEFIGAIKNVKGNVDGGQINDEVLIQIIRNIWKKSAEFVSEAMGRNADQKEKKAAFRVLLNPLDDLVSASILNVVMRNLGGNLDFDQELHQIKLEGFVEIIE